MAGEEVWGWKGRGGEGGGGEWTICKGGRYNQTGFNFTVERNFYWDRRSRRQPETEKDGRKSVGKLGRESTVAIRGTTFPLSLIRASCTLCINLPPRAPPSSSVGYRCCSLPTSVFCWNAFPRWLSPDGAD